MHQSLQILRTSRNVISQFLDNYTLDQLNTIPPGFSNNLIWNIGHIVVVQQMLVYNLSGLPMMVSDAMVEKYKRGTRPEAPVTQQEVGEIRGLLFAPIEKNQADLDAGIFKEFRSFTSMSGYLIENALDAMAFNNYHEATHTGIMMSIRKFI